MCTAVKMVEVFEAPQETAGSPQESKPSSTQPSTDRPSIYVAVPAYGCIMCNQFFIGMIRLYQLCRQQGIVCYFDVLGNESLITRARNVLVERFLRSPATHLMFIDADISFDPQAVLRLLAANKPCVTGTYPKKTVNWSMVQKKLEQKLPEPVHQQGLDFNLNVQQQRVEVVNGFVKVLDSATGFMLIQRSVFQMLLEKLPQHIKKVRNDTMGLNINTYHVFFDCIVEPDTRRYLSEDFTFCRWVQMAGGEIWTDVASPLMHFGSYVFQGDPKQRIKSSAASAPSKLG